MPHPSRPHRLSSHSVNGPLRPLPTDPEALIPAKDVQAYIGLARQTLARRRVQGGGPPFVKVGASVLYRAGDLRKWLAQNTFSSTSAYSRSS